MAEVADGETHRRAGPSDYVELGNIPPRPPALGTYRTYRTYRLSGVAAESLVSGMRRKNRPGPPGWFLSMS